MRAAGAGTLAVRYPPGIPPFSGLYVAFRSSDNLLPNVFHICAASWIQIPATTRPAQSEAFLGGRKLAPPSACAHTHARESQKSAGMGKEEKKAKHSTAPNSQSQTGKAPGGEKSTDSTQESAVKKKKKQKKAKGDPKSGQEEESHTCCGCRFPLLFALLQLALGTSVTVLGFLMAGISSSLLVRDTPYWAGIIVSIKSVSP